jgi:DNA-binding NtrC family response regulator
MYRILLIEDDANARRAADGVLSALGHHVVSAGASDATWLLDTDRFDVVIAGVEPAAVPTPPPPRVPQTLVYLARPFKEQDVVDAVRGLQERDAIQRELAEATAVLGAREPSSRIVGRSSAIARVLERIAAVADSDASVLLTGESGTGKDLVAQTIHAGGVRRDKPLVAINCAAFPDTLLEAELFGHERGAFTGALHKRDGRFKAACGGTLFLDEINGLSMAAQAKLLRVLQDGTFQPLGTNTTHSVDVRLIAATNRPLKALVAEGKFREDLYYRVNVLDIDIPPLRDRKGDLSLLVQHFLGKFARPGRAEPTLSPRAWAALTQHAFPGNVRELEHAIQRALVLSRGGEIELEHLPRDLCPPGAEAVVSGDVEMRTLAEAVRDFEAEYVQRALLLSRGNKTRAARLLGISRKNLWHKLSRMPAPGGDAEPAPPAQPENP